MLKIRAYKHTIAVILLSIFTAYYTDVTLFLHSHTINGVTIVHSHFHGDNHLKTNNHKTSELTLIALNDAFSSLAPEVFTFAIAIFTVLLIPFVQSKPKIANGEYISNFHLRGPPAFSL